MTNEEYWTEHHDRGEPTIKIQITPYRRLIDAVKAHAVEHYTEGWDVIVECYGDTEIENVLRGEGVFSWAADQAAINAFKGLVGLQEEKRAAQGYHEAQRELEQGYADMYEDWKRQHAAQ
jgi:hypothetical protein